MGAPAVPRALLRVAARRAQVRAHHVCVNRRSSSSRRGALRGAVVRAAHSALDAKPKTRQKPDQRQARAEGAAVHAIGYTRRAVRSRATGPAGPLTCFIHARPSLDRLSRAHACRAACAIGSCFLAFQIPVAMCAAYEEWLKKGKEDGWSAEAGRNLLAAAQGVKELVIAAKEKKPVIALVNPDASDGGLSIDEIKLQLLAAEASLREVGLRPWPDALRSSLCLRAHRMERRCLGHDAPHRRAPSSCCPLVAPDPPTLSVRSSQRRPPRPQRR